MTSKSIAAVLFALVLTLAACSKASTSSDAADPGSDAGGSSAEAYVDTLCSSLDTWLTTVSSEASAQGTSTNPKAAKKEVVSFLESMSASTQTLIDELNEAGVPDVENGAAAHTALLAAFTAVDEALDQALDQAKSLSTKDATAFNAQLSAIQALVQAASAKVTTALNGLTSAELDQAAAESEACTSLLSTTSAVPTS